MWKKLYPDILSVELANSTLYTRYTFGSIKESEWSLAQLDLLAPFVHCWLCYSPNTINTCSYWPRKRLTRHWSRAKLLKYSDFADFSQKFLKTKNCAFEVDAEYRLCGLRRELGGAGEEEGETWDTWSFVNNSWQTSLFFRFFSFNLPFDHSWFAARTVKQMAVRSMPA